VGPSVRQPILSVRPAMALGRPSPRVLPMQQSLDAPLRVRDRLLVLLGVFLWVFVGVSPAPEWGAADARFQYRLLWSLGILGACTVPLWNAIVGQLSAAASVAPLEMLSLSMVYEVHCLILSVCLSV
jgi:hypothetical protein